MQIRCQTTKFTLTIAFYSEKHRRKNFLRRLRRLCGRPNATSNCQNGGYGTLVKSVLARFGRRRYVYRKSYRSPEIALRQRVEERLRFGDPGAHGRF